MSVDAEAQVGAAFQAMAAGYWAAARDGFAAVLDVAEVPEALLGLATASYWLGDLEAVIESFEKAYAAARKRSHSVLAAAAALSRVGYREKRLVYTESMSDANGSVISPSDIGMPRGTPPSPKSASNSRTSAAARTW